MNDIKEMALDIMEEACETDEIREDLDLDLFDAGLMDSLASVAILLEIEKKLGVRLEPTDVEKEEISTVNHFIHFLEKLQK